ncbi:MAG: AAA family ATPase [Rhodopirellula sp.]|nr:AAA family ATPase [Rhodopirellula sp.]
MSILLDIPVSDPKHDYLQFGPLVKLVTNRIRQTEPRAHDCFGVYGAWGSGKTSLLRLVQASCGETVTWVDFDALRYQSQTDVLAPLLHEVARSLDSSQDAFRFAAKLSMAAAGTAASALLEFVPHGKAFKDALGEFNKLLENSTETPSLPESPADTLRRTFAELVETLSQQFHRRLVITIDNLDRCRPESVLNVIEAIHLLLNVPGCTFVLGVDQQTLIGFINSRYSSGTFHGAMYLEKLIPDYFRISDPWVSSRAERKLADMDSVQRLLHALFQEEPCKALQPYKNPIWRLLGNARAMRNPRRIKRIIRRLSLLPPDYWRTLKKLREKDQTSAKESFAALFFLAALSDLWPHVYEFLPYAEPSEWRGFIWHLCGDPEIHFDNDEDIPIDTDVFAKHPNLERGIELREFVTAVSQWSCTSDVWSDAAFKRSLVWQYDELWDLMDLTSSIGF